MKKFGGFIYFFAGIVLVVGMSCNSLFAQDTSSYFDTKQYVIKRWNNEDGLPQNTIFDIVKDDIGYLWVSTEEGLVRFDGEEFTVYNREQIPKLQSNYFSDIELSSTGGLWAASRTFILKKQKYSSDIFDFENYLGNTRIQAIAEVGKDSLWIGTHAGQLFFMDDGKVHEMEPWNDDHPRIIQHLKEISDGILIGTSRGLFKWNNNSKSLHALSGLDSVNVRALKIDENKDIWIGTEKRGLLQLSGDKIDQFSTDHGLPEPFITSLDIDGNGTIWVGTSSSGLYTFQNNIFTRTGENESLRDDIKSIKITDDNTVWLGSSGTGLVMMSPADIYRLNNDLQISNEIILPIYEQPSGEIWLGTAGKGLFRLSDGNSTQFTREDGLANEIVLSVYGADKKIYAGTAGGLSIFNPETDRFDKTFTVDDGLASNIVQSVYEASDKKIWIATRAGGLHTLESDRINRIELPNSLDGADLITFFEDQDGTMWVGSLESGMLSIDPNKQARHYTESDGLPTNNIYCFYEDQHGDLWICMDGGLAYYDNQNFYTLDRSNGLGSRTIFNIIEDEDGYLWLSHNFGLEQIALDQLNEFKKDLSPDFQISARTFNSSDGMENSEANGGVFPAGWKMADNSIWFPTVEGVAIVDPSHIRNNQSSVDAHIQNMRFANNVYSPDQNITLPPGVHNIEINYTAIDFAKPDAIQFSYRLAGLSNQWQSVNRQRTVYVSALSPGTYTFEVRAAKYGTSSNIAAFSFSVDPFFYQTWWFRTGLLILIFLAGYIVKQLHEKSKEEEKLKTLVEKRTKVLQDTLSEKDALINEVYHRVKNNLAIISAFMELQSSSSHSEETKVALADNQSRIKSIASIHDLLYQVDSFSELDFKKVMEKILINISEIYSSRKVVDLKTDLETIILNVNQAIPFALIANEIISNSYKHAFGDRESGTIRITLQKKNDHIFLEISDNGKGFPKNVDPKTHDSLGLKLIQIQIEQLNANLIVESVEGTSYKIEFERTQLRGSASNIL